MDERTQSDEALDRGAAWEALKTAVARATGCPHASIRLRSRPPIDHQSNQLYDAWAGGRHLIAKEFRRPEEFDEAPVREFHALELLTPLDIAPHPVLLQPSPGPELGPIVVYDFMEGEMWDRRRPTAAELAQLADLWLRMNAAVPESSWPSRGHDRPLSEVETSFRARFHDYATWADARFPQARRAADLCLAALDHCRPAIEELAGCDPPLCFCRADTRVANVIRRPDGRSGMIDWEDSGLRDPARDLADLLTHPNQEDLLASDEWQAFFHPYLAVRAALDPQLHRRTELYLALFPLFWLALLVTEGVQRARTGRPTSWPVNGLPVNQRLRRYLARALAWPESDGSNRLASLEPIAFFPGE